MMALANTSELPPGTTRKFTFQRDGREQEGFLANVNGQIVAYENLCRHRPLSLDYGDNQFFSPDGRHLICSTHGAEYDPLSGECVLGPCRGERLWALRIKINDGVIWLQETGEADPHS